VPAAQPPDQLAFEVASVKPNKSGGVMNLGFKGDQFTATNQPLGRLIAIAFGSPRAALPRSQMSGGPDWLDTDRFNIEAKAPSGLAGGQEWSWSGLAGADLTRSPQVDEMLRTLLAERFKLTVHHETRELPVYALVVARSDQRLGSQLRSVQVDCAALLAAARPGGPPSGPASLHDRPVCSLAVRTSSVVGEGVTIYIVGGGVTMGQLADLLSVGTVDRLVRDHTGLAGTFDLELSWKLDQSPIDSNGVSIFSAIQEELGLRLNSTKEPVDVLVIDHVEHPTDD
jgi:uncharacterized protein (TIGR03435 family)